MPEAKCFPYNFAGFTPLGMCRRLRSVIALLVLGLWAAASFASAYNAQPKLVVIIVVDQLRGDLLERYHDDFGDGGFRLLMDHGAWFTACYFNYASEMTAPGHATIGTGTYVLGHGILANSGGIRSCAAWSPAWRTKAPSSSGCPKGVAGEKWSGSPHNLQTDTIGDELKLATGGRAKVFGVALKDRAAILPVGCRPTQRSSSIRNRARSLLRLITCAGARRGWCDSTPAKRARAI